MKKLILAGALALMSTGCFHIKYTTNAAAEGTAKPAMWHHTLIVGLIELGPVDLAKECPNGVSSVENQVTFLDGFLGGLTESIWHPNSVTITCGSGGAAPAPATPPAGGGSN